ncbi:hypothetical protein NPX79_02440 [Spiroplasma endosymbiont of Anurida maritima]|uniref:hypothetical protein n=1 Tax=Spiroplasma endosymbiont of Anurida maritima TaxID=2967972 RepID=UPI0036D25073
MGKIKHGSIVEIGDNLFIVLSILDKTSLLAKLTRTNTNDTNKYFSAHDIKKHFKRCLWKN